MKKVSNRLIIITVLLTLFQVIPYCLSDNYFGSYSLIDQTNGSRRYNLNIAVSESLYEYYLEKNHQLTLNDDFAKFVTPYALYPIAINLREIYLADEDFVNGALMIVHQIPYVETAPPKYPVETLVENEGDCDLFSYIAASILKSGGLDVVLIYYENEKHMNVGVNLSQMPADAREQAYYVTYNNLNYYVAECTGNNWEDGWRVGECPDELKDSSIQVITLENSEPWAAGQVSASYSTLMSSEISLTIESKYVFQGGLILLSGQLLPELENKTVEFYFKINNDPWMFLDGASTDSEGRYSFVWNAKNFGICVFRASWSGDSAYAGADSAVKNIVILPASFFLISIFFIILVSLCCLMFFISKSNQKKAQFSEEIYD